MRRGRRRRSSRDTLRDLVRGIRIVPRLARVRQHLVEQEHVHVADAEHDENAELVRQGHRSGRVRGAAARRTCIAINLRSSEQTHVSMSWR